MFDKVGNPLTLSQEIELKIEEAIRLKKLEQGQKLPSEKDLCAMFGVSRTALREALRMLSARGLLTIKKGAGVYVNNYSSLHASKTMSLYLELQFDKDYMLHLVTVRQMLEPSIAKLAARNRTKRDLLRLERNLEAFVKKDQDAEQLAKYDVEFHMTIAEATGNPLIPLIMDPLYSMLPRIKELIVSRLKENKSSNASKYHRKIYEMLKKQDEEGVFNAMTDHLKIALKDTLNLIKIIETEDKQNIN
ncbi:MAG: FadR/GntR family transcriptional regulator [candidate division KSB1 bacterium]|jgi:GntR family transcriptional repressor for pyruvate dehydrogenase complex|nr:FadR/GntR family transcriptional regulator [candidate division KSB1 bacterium]